MRPRLGILAWLCALGFVAALSLYFASANGIGLTHDAGFYLSVRKTGMLTRSTWWPPAYPGIFVVLENAGVGAQVGARWLNV